RIIRRLELAPLAIGVRPWIVLLLSENKRSLSRIRKSTVRVVSATTVSKSSRHLSIRSERLAPVDCIARSIVYRRQQMLEEVSTVRHFTPPPQYAANCQGTGSVSRRARPSLPNVLLTSLRSESTSRTRDRPPPAGSARAQTIEINSTGVSQSAVSVC